MKKVILLLIMLNFAGSYAFAQQQVSEKEKKVSYSFINEYGLNAGVSFDADPFVEITGVFVNSICFNKKQDLIGIGVGFDLFYVVIVPAFPVFVNYRHYFTSITNLKPLINVALGTRINIWGEAGLYSTIAGGFRYKALSFTLGFSMKTFNDANYFGGAEVKVGYTF